MTPDDVFREFTRILLSIEEPWQDAETTKQTSRVKEALRQVGDTLEPSGTCAPCYTLRPLYAEFMVDFCCMDRQTHGNASRFGVGVEPISGKGDR